MSELGPPRRPTPDYVAALKGITPTGLWHEHGHDGTADQPGLEAVRVTYVKPETGGDTDDVFMFDGVRTPQGDYIGKPQAV